MGMVDVKDTCCLMRPVGGPCVQFIAGVFHGRSGGVGRGEEGRGVPLLSPMEFALCVDSVSVW